MGHPSCSYVVLLRLLDFAQDAFLVHLQSSLRDFIVFRHLPRTASWVKFSRPRSTSSGQALRDSSGGLALVLVPVVEEFGGDFAAYLVVRF